MYLKSPVRVFLLLLLPLWAHAQSGGEDRIQYLSEQLLLGSEVTIAGATLASAHIIPELYSRREFTPAWTDSAQVDEFLAKALVEGDPAAKTAYMREVHRLIHQDQPYTFLWSLRSFTALRREVESAYVQPFYYFTQFPDWKLRSE